MPAQNFATASVRPARIIVGISLGLSAVMALVLGLRSTIITVIPTMLVLLIMLAWYLAGYLARRRRSVGPIVVLAAMNMALIVPELGLRLAEFRYESGIWYGSRPGDFARFDFDQDLFWKLPASRENVNSLGFPGREIDPLKPPDVYRIAFIGDSCTQQGYPDMVEQELNRVTRDSQDRIECVTLAVGGYSSHQGRIIAQKYASLVQPDLVVVFFGWNDHWRAYGTSDSLKRIRTPGPSVRALAPMAELMPKSRLLQAARWTIDRLAGAGSSALLSEPRVAPQEYRDNLARIEQIFSELNVPVIFLTAPTSHYQLGMPDDLVRYNYVADTESGMRAHRAYNEIVRAVASDTGSFLIDLEAELASLSDPRSVFTKDGIHFTPEGLRRVAARLTNFISTSVLPDRYAHAARPAVNAPQPTATTTFREQRFAEKRPP